MARPISKADKELRDEALARFKFCEDYWGENRKNWKEDTRFCVPGNQWPEKIRKLREDANRPCLEVDQLNQYVRQVVNDGRQNRAAVKVRPIDSGADEDTADAFQGLIRSIFDRSNGDEALDTALEHAARAGFGFIRIATEYANDNTFNQDIVIMRVRNPLTVMLGPHQKADGSDAQYGFVMTDLTKDEFKRKYPKAQVSDWTLYADGWTSKDTVRVCEYFYSVDVTKTIVLLEDDTTATIKDYEADLRPDKPAIKDQRDIPSRAIKWCRLSGAEILEKNDWMGKYIPIIPVYGNEIDIEGKVNYFGLIRPAKDSQTLYNFSRSGFAEAAGFVTKAPWIAAAEAIAGFESEWATANTSNAQVLHFRAFTDDGQQIPPPQRTPPGAVPNIFVQDMQQSAHDVQASMGMYAASVGQPSNEKSGRAIMARQREGDTSTFHYQDNQSRAIRYLGRQLVDLVPKIYDAKRTLRILGEDGSVSQIDLDPDQDKASHKAGALSIYNFGVGTYDVSVAAGPSFTTKRQEAAEAAIELTKANPTMWQTHGDLIVKMQDWPYSEEFAERSKLTLPPPIQQALAQKEQGQDPKVQMVVSQANQMLGQAKQAIQEREQALQQMQEQMAQMQQELQAAKQANANKMGDVAVKAAQAETQQFVAETERFQVLGPQMTPEAIAAIVQKTVAEIMAQPAPAVQ